MKVVNEKLKTAVVDWTRGYEPERQAYVGILKNLYMKLNMYQDLEKYIIGKHGHSVNLDGNNFVLQDKNHLQRWMAKMSIPGADVSTTVDEKQMILDIQEEQVLNQLMVEIRN